MNWLTILISLALAIISAVNSLLAEEARPNGAQLAEDMPAPSTPLIACDPYFSVWSSAPRLTDVDTTHWTGKAHRLTSMIAIDGTIYRLMGAAPAEVPAATQTGRVITPTQTKYSFSIAGVDVSLKFSTPALPDDLDLLSRPITYVTYEVRSSDGAAHQVRIYFEAAAELTVNTPDQRVAGIIERPQELVTQRLGSEEQAVLKRKGDDVRIDWGYLYLAANSDDETTCEIGAAAALREKFKSGRLEPAASRKDAVRADQLSAAICFEVPKVGSEPVARWLIAAYDDLYSIEYMKRPLRPYWRRDGKDAHALLAESARDYAAVLERCDRFDAELTADLERVGGPEYAWLGALSYRQCFAAGKFVADANGQPIQFCKENHSNGCIGTSDVFYPMSPQFLLFGPSLAKSFLVPFMNYAESERWTFRYAPHDLGTYPKANGQVYGGGETSERDQMPVEESGNLLILMAAVARLEGHAEFAGRYWPQLKQWAEYLREKGFDPENQLCTDDFAGHLGHNVNLSAKAICALGAFAQLCEMRGESALAAEYRATAEKFAAKWVEEADDGDHFRLAFDKPGTWSQKYNLVWDRILDLGLFPAEVRRKEMDHYRSMQGKYGLPLDNRQPYTKLDWILWTATLTENPDDFRALVTPVSRFLRETPDRAPLTDWYQTDTAKQVGFTARPVVGGVFLPLLYDDEVWSKWARRDGTSASAYAKLPTPPVVLARVPAADTTPSDWHYTTRQPEGDWRAADYDCTGWSRGPSGFGTAHTPGTHVQTVWDSDEIWLRREFDLHDTAIDDLQLHIHHDEDVEVYINGILALRSHGYLMGYEQAAISPAAREALKPTGNVLAVYCRQTSGGQYIDVGLVSVEDR